MAWTEILDHQLLPHLAKLIVALVLLRVFRRLYGALASPLRDVPGPFLARFTKVWKLRQFFAGNFEQQLIELHAKYGPIVRVSPNEYSIDDESSIATIYGHGSKFIKTEWYSGSDDPSRPEEYSLFTVRDPTFHASQRRKTAALYAMSSLVWFEPLMNECSSIFQARLDEFAASGERINITHWAQCYAFDVVGQITFLKRFGFLDKGEDVGGILKTIDAILEYIYPIGLYPSVHKWVFPIIKALTASNPGMAALQKFTETAMKELATTTAEVGDSSERRDFLSRLTSLQRSSPEKYTDWDVVATCRDVVGAGSDTTGITLAAVLYHIYDDSLVVEALRKEIQQMEKKQALSDPISFNEARQMPYLQAVIKEAMRMHPAVGFSLDRTVPPEGAVIAKRFFPGGTVVGTNCWVAHRNKAFWGPDADVFRPERWLESQERATQLDRYYIPFGSGSRTCIGKNIALMELSKIVPQIVRRYDLELAYNEDGKAYKTVTRNFVKQKDFYGRIKKL